MKKYKRFYFIFLILFLNSSCNDWFEVSADNEITKEDLFSTYDGVRTALNGLYRSLSTTDLYAQNLSYGFISYLGQNYGSQAYNLSITYKAVNDFEYDHANVEPIIAGIWENAYYSIANCNILINEVESKDSSFFPLGQVEKDLVIGEAKGLRALMHFDLLRLFAPAPIKDDNAKYIPYVSEYPVILSELLSVQEVITRIVKDLEDAMNLLEYNDTDYNYRMMSTLNYRLHDNVTGSANGGLFFSRRLTRMNYFGACALLARVHLYNNNKELAYQYATRVYVYKNWFPFTSSVNIEGSSLDNRHCKLPDDLLFCLYNNNMAEMYTQFMSYNSINYMQLNFITELFGTDTDDFRRTGVITDYYGTYYTLKWNDVNVETISKNEVPLIPIIRMCEIYYIMCEYLAENGQLSYALELLNELRLGRGAKKEVTALNSDEFMNLLLIDATREYLTDGQTFYMYKRLNRPVFFGSNTWKDISDYWVLPIPKSETSFY